MFASASVGNLSAQSPSATSDDGADGVTGTPIGGGAERVRSGTRMTYLPPGSSPATLYSGSISSGRVRVMRYSTSRTLSKPALRHKSLSALYMKKAVQEYNAEEEKSRAASVLEEKSNAHVKPSTDLSDAVAQVSNLTVAAVRTLGPPSRSRRTSVSRCSMASIAEEDSNCSDSEDHTVAGVHMHVQPHCRSVSLTIDPGVVDVDSNNEPELVCSNSSSATKTQSSTASERDIAPQTPSASSRDVSKAEAGFLESGHDSLNPSLTLSRSNGGNYEELSQTSVTRSESSQPTESSRLSTQILISVDKYAGAAEVELVKR